VVLTYGPWFLFAGVLSSPLRCWRLAWSVVCTCTGSACTRPRNDRTSRLVRDTAFPQAGYAYGHLVELLSRKKGGFEVRDTPVSPAAYVYGHSVEMLL
jgi:hypothetical protein